MSNSNQRVVLIIGSIAIILVGALLILSAMPTGGPAAPAPAASAPQNSAPPVAQPTPAEIPYSEIVRVGLGDAKAAYDLKQAIYLDVRDADSYASGHIPGALSIPLNNLEARLKELDPNAWILTYCT